MVSNSCTIALIFTLFPLQIVLPYLEVHGLYCALFVDGCRDHAFFSLGFMLVDDSLNFRFVSSPDSTTVFRSSWFVLCFICRRLSRSHFFSLGFMLVDSSLNFRFVSNSDCSTVYLEQWFLTFFIHRPILQSEITKRPPSMQINKND